MPKVEWKEKEHFYLDGVIREENLELLKKQILILTENKKFQEWIYFFSSPSFLNTTTKPTDKVVSPDILTQWKDTPVVKDSISIAENSYLTIHAKLENLIQVMTFLKTEENFLYNFLLDLTAVDFLNSPSELDKKNNQGKRFQMLYMLRSIQPDTSSPFHGLKIKIVTPVDEKDKIPSLVDLWVGANWPEREVFDLMGLYFEGHPNLKRILMPLNYKGHPLRKDFPIEGIGEDYLIEDLLKDPIVYDE